MEKEKERRKWILVVEDEEDIRRMVSDLIQGMGPDYGVVESKDGLEAKTRLDNQAFQCILTDLNMPKVTGQGVIQYARSSRLNGTTPIIVVTAYPDPKVVTDFEYVIQMEKPFNPKDLAKLIEEQVKLGPTDQRIPIQLFNLFMSSVSAWAEKQGLKPQFETPRGKASVTDMVADHYVFIRYQFNALKAWVGLGFEASFIEKMGQAPQIFGLTMSDEVSQLMAAKATALFKAEIMKTVERIQCTKAELGQYAASDFKGITMPMKTEKGSVFVEALVGKVTLRKVR